MMRTLLYKNYYVILFMAFAMMSFANNDGRLKGKYTKEKTIKKEFNVNPDALLKVRNSYGNLNITSWNENRVVLEVSIRTNGNNEEKVTKRLQQITVDFENSDRLVSARTRFGEKDNRWGWSWGKRNNVSVQVNYTIKVPIKNSVNLNNDYGHIYLDRIDGHAKISCDYGKIEIGELRGRNNELRFDYTSNSTFEYVNSAEIIADYSKYTIEKAGDLRVNADYTQSVIQEMGNLEYSSDYGSIEVGSVQNIRGNGDYVGVKLGRVYGNVDITADYGSVKIDHLTAEAGNVNIKLDYTGARIGYDSNYNFDFEISAEYAGISGKDDFVLNISKEKSNDKYYKGYRGVENSGNTVYITTDYGNVKFERKQ